MAVDLPALRTVQPMAVDALEKMPTKALLKRLADLRALQESPEKSDWSEDELRTVGDAGLIAFKDSPVWMQAFSDAKSILDNREHVPRGGKEARRRAQKEKQMR